MDQRPLILIPAGSSDGKTLAYDAATGLAKPTGYSNAEVDAALAALSGSIGGVESALTAHSNDATIHRSINDAGSAATDLWSASKISTELAGKLDKTGGTIDGSLSVNGDIIESGEALETKYAKVDGTSSQAFQIGDGPLLKNVSGDLQLRNAADTANGNMEVRQLLLANPSDYALVADGIVQTYEAFEAGLPAAGYTRITPTQISITGGGIPVTLTKTELTFTSGNSVIDAATLKEKGTVLRERYTRQFLGLESTADLVTLDAQVGDQATVETGLADEPYHRYELVGDDLDDGAYDAPAENPANWRRIVALDADGEIKGPVLNRFVLDTDDTDVARIGEIVCVVDDLDAPTTASYRMGDGSTKTADLPEIATVTP